MPGVWANNVSEGPKVQPREILHRAGKKEQPETIPIPKLKIKNGEHLKEQTSLPVKSLKPKPKLQRTKSYTAPQPETEKPQTLPAQTLDKDNSFHHKMKQLMQQKETRYQTMMSNAF